MRWSATGPAARARLRARLLRRGTLAAVLVALLAGNGLVWQATQAAFSATTVNGGNAMAGGTVALTDNDASDTQTLFDLDDLIPGDTATSCIQVTYSGTLPGTVRLYASTTGTGLGGFLTLTVTRGTISSGSFGDCANFVPDATNYGSGAGVIYTGNLVAFPANYASGLADPRTMTTPEVWTTGEVHAYKFQTVLQDTDSAQNKSATTAFSWQAANTSQYSQVVLSDGPASYWKLDETVGTTATDAMGVRNGTYASSPTLGVTSGVKDANTAISVDGVNSYVTFGDIYDFAGTLPFSIETWTKTTLVSGSTGIVNKYNGGTTRGWFLGIDSSGGVAYIDRYNATVGVESRGTTDILAAGGWHHLVGTYDGANLKIYVDGVLEGSLAAAQSLVDSPTAVVIYSNTATTVDELAIYSYALNATQVADHYTAGKR